MDRAHSPTHFYSLALCVHLIAYVCSIIAAFTPEWSSITERTGLGIKETYDKGIIISCNIPGGSTGCEFNKDIAGSSSVFFACFLVVIAYIVIGFFALQLLVGGICVRSLRERNLGIPLLVLFVLLLILVVLAISLFEASVTKDITPGSDYEEHTFGISRFGLIGSLVLYFICTFFALGEHLKRKSSNSVTQSNKGIVSMDSIPPASKSNTFYSTNSNSNNNKNNTHGRRNDSISNSETAKGSTFIRGENKSKSYNDDYNPTPNRQRQATTSIIPLQGHTYLT